MQAALDALAANTRRRRNQLGLTQSQLAAACGVELRHIQRIEGAEANPSLQMVVSLAVALDVPLPSLFRPAALTKQPVGRPRGKRKKAER